MVAETVAVQVPQYIMDLTRAEVLWAKQAEVLEKALARIDEVQRDVAYTPEFKGERVNKLNEEALGAAAELYQGWLRQLAASEATAQKEARDGAEVRSEIFQLAKSNGLALLNLMADLGDGQALLDEFDEVLLRGVAGEINAWATALPMKLELLGRTNPHLRGGLPAVRARCAEVLAGQKSAKQREAEAKLEWFTAQRRRVEMMEALSGGKLNSLRHRVERLRREVPAAV